MHSLMQSRLPCLEQGLTHDGLHSKEVLCAGLLVLAGRVPGWRLEQQSWQVRDPIPETCLLLCVEAAIHVVWIPPSPGAKLCQLGVCLYLNSPPLQTHMPLRKAPRVVCQQTQNSAKTCKFSRARQSPWC